MFSCRSIYSEIRDPDIIPDIVELWCCRNTYIRVIYWGRSSLSDIGPKGMYIFTAYSNRIPCFLGQACPWFPATFTGYFLLGKQIAVHLFAIQSAMYAAESILPIGLGCRIHRGSLSTCRCGVGVMLLLFMLLRSLNWRMFLEFLFTAKDNNCSLVVQWWGEIIPPVSHIANDIGYDIGYYIRYFTGYDICV